MGNSGVLDHKFHFRSIVSAEVENMGIKSMYMYFAYLVRQMGYKSYNGHDNCPQPTPDRMNLYRPPLNTDYSWESYPRMVALE